MLVGNGKKGINSLAETCGIMLPKQIGRKHAHGIHANLLRPSQFLINFLRIKGLGLPHFELVDSICGNVIAADRPSLSRVPSIGLFFRPTLRMDSRDRTQSTTQSKQANKGNSAFHGHLFRKWADHKWKRLHYLYKRTLFCDK